jgi:hypothetical protein
MPITGSPGFSAAFFCRDSNAAACAFFWAFAYLSFPLALMVLEEKFRKGENCWPLIDTDYGVSLGIGKCTRSSSQHFKGHGNLGGMVYYGLRMR